MRDARCERSCGDGCRQGQEPYRLHYHFPSRDKLAPLPLRVIALAPSNKIHTEAKISIPNAQAIASPPLPFQMSSSAVEIVCVWMPFRMIDALSSGRARMNTRI